MYGFEANNMMNKKQSEYLLGDTQFILEMPVLDVVEKLLNLSQFHVSALNATNGEHYFEVTYAKTAKKQKVYVALKTWNKTETFVTLSPNSFSAIVRNKSLRWMLLGASVMIIVPLLLIEPAIGFIYIACLMMLSAYFNRHNNFGRISLGKTISVDPKMIEKERLINQLVNHLTDNGNVQLINS